MAKFRNKYSKINNREIEIHILILPSWYPNHPNDVQGVFFREQALALKKSGFNIGVVAPQIKSLRKLFDKRKNSYKRVYEIDEGIPTYRDDIYLFVPKLDFSSYFFYKILAKRMVNDYIRKHGKPDLIHAHCAIFAGIVATEIGKDKGIPVVITEHSSGFARNLYSKFKLRLAHYAFSRANEIIAVSPKLSELLTNQFKKLNKKITFIPNMVGDTFFYTEKKRSKPFKFLNLSLISENKGQHDLICAFNLVIQKGIDAELWIAGDGEKIQELKLQVKKLNLNKNIKFMGYVQPTFVPELLKQVDALVISSYYETFGVVAVEALMSGVPVISTRCGGPECIIGPNDGFLVPVKDHRKMFNALVKMIETIETFDPIEISQRAHQRFSSKSLIEHLSQIYKNIILEKNN